MQAALVISLYSRLLIQDHSDSAVHAGVVSEYRELEVGVAGCVERSGLIILLNAVEEDLAGSGDTASDNDDVGIHNAGDVRDRFTQHLSDSFQNGDRELIAGLGIVKYILGGERIQVAQRGLRGRIRFQGQMSDVEFGNAVPSEAKGRICVNPREFNANLKGRTAQAQVSPFAECGSPSIYFLFLLFLRLLLLRFR